MKHGLIINWITILNSIFNKLNENTIFCILIKWIGLLILHKEVNLGCTCDRYKRAYSMFSRGDQYSDFLIFSAEKPFWMNKYIVQNDKTFLDGATSKVFDILSKFPARIHLMTFYKAHQQLKTAILKIKHYNGTVQSNLIWYWTCCLTVGEYSLLPIMKLLYFCNSRQLCVCSEYQCDLRNSKLGPLVLQSLATSTVRRAQAVCSTRDVCSVKCTDCVQWEGHFLQYKFAIAGSSLNKLMCFTLQLIYNCMFRNLFLLLHILPARYLAPQPQVELWLCRELWFNGHGHCFRVWTSLTLFTVWNALKVICRPVEVSNFNIFIDVLWLFLLDITWFIVHYFRWVSVYEPHTWFAIG